MNRTLRVLIIDDSEPDALLIVNELKENGFELSWLRVDTLEQLKQAVENNAWDIVIADYIMPQFSAVDVINYMKRNSPGLPIVVVSGMLSNVIAPELINAGANDFIEKDQLPRLVAVVKREIKQSAGRQNDTAAPVENNGEKSAIPGKIRPYMTLKKRFGIIFLSIMSAQAGIKHP
jgi:DNA-binding NtrC family response regulator